MTTSVRVILCVSAIACAATGTQPGLSAQGPSPFENVAVGVHVYFPDGRVASTWSSYKGDKVLSVVAVVVSHLALTDISHGAGGSAEWQALQVSFALIIAFQLSALVTLWGIIRSSHLHH